MISRLVALAKAQGLDVNPCWEPKTVWVHDLATGAGAEQRRPVLVPKRTANVAKRPGFLIETKANLKRDDVRGAMLEMVKRWAGRCDHPLLAAAIEALSEPAALLAIVPDGWVALAWHGAIAGDIPEVRALAHDEIATNEGDGALALCIGCGQMRPAVRLHGGVPAYSGGAPVLCCANRGPITEYLHGPDGGRLSQGDLFPTCRECMLLYVAALNHLVSDGRWVQIGDGPRAITEARFAVDGEEWALGGSNGSGWIAGIRSEEEARREAVLYARTKWVDKEGRINMQYMATDLPFPGGQAPETDPHFWTGYLYGSLEWIAWVCRMGGFPQHEEVMAAPSRVMGDLRMRVVEAAGRYSPPATKTKGKAKDAGPRPPVTRRDLLMGRLRSELAIVAEHMPRTPACHMTPDERGRFADGYAFFLASRPPARMDAALKGRITPWQMALANALTEAGFLVHVEHEVTRVSGGRYFVDVAAMKDPDGRAGMLAIEVDGRLDGMERRDHVLDSTRAAELLTLGWTVYRVPNRRLSSAERISEVVAEVRAICASRWVIPS